MANIRKVWPRVAAAATCLILATPLWAAEPSIPHLRQQGSVTQLVVDGRPFVMLAGELHNSSASGVEYMRQLWPHLKALGLNTVLAPVSWELTEPAEGQFDLSYVDAMLELARQHGQRLVLLWFGSWKNGVSSYAPVWVLKDIQRFPRAKGSSHQNTKDMLSTLSPVNLKADAAAFARLLRHLKEVDGKEHTVVMVQVENEVGIKPETRDLSDEANRAFRAVLILLGLGALVCSGRPGLALADQNLPRDPDEAVRLENDILGARLWGPPGQPTLSLGRSDIWDRRWFGDRQPIVTLRRLRELAMQDRLAEVAASPNSTIYDVYGKCDFPCPKPAAQAILATPFATSARVEPDGFQSVRLTATGSGKELVARIWVAADRPLVVAQCRAKGLVRDDFWVRVYRHRDTIIPGEPVSPTIGGRPSAKDFEQMAPPRAWQERGQWGIVQDFPAEMTYSGGFRVLVGAAMLGLEPVVQCCEGGKGLGTPLWAAQEGRLNHGVVKRYRPINEATGAAATARFSAIPDSFTLLLAIATTQDGPDPRTVAGQTLREAVALGSVKLAERQAETLRLAHRKVRAVARVNGREILAAPAVVLPDLRKPGGYYGDVPLCSVGSTKFCFQDAGLWHDDFHLNEIRAEGMLTLGQFEELLPYCRMIRTLLPQAEENARDVYGLPGAMYPLVHFPLRCRGIAHTNLTWEQDMGLNGLVSKPLWLYYRYTGDREFLRDTAYPVLRQCARFGLFTVRSLKSWCRGWAGMSDNPSPMHTVRGVPNVVVERFRGRCEPRQGLASHDPDFAVMGDRVMENPIGPRHRVAHLVPVDSVVRVTVENMEVTPSSP